MRISLVQKIVCNNYLVTLTILITDATALKIFTDTIPLSKVYHFRNFSSQNKIDRMVSNDLVAVIHSDLKILLKIVHNIYHAYQINY